MRAGWLWVAAVAVLVLLASGCGGDDDISAGAASAQSSDAAASDSGGDDAVVQDDDGAEAPAGGSGSGGAGSVVLGDETIVFDSALCFLQEQAAAAGGGKILFVAQGNGTNAEGEPALIDVSRFDEESQFTGDKITLDIGDPFSGESVSWAANVDLGTVVVEGSTVRADNLTFVNFDEGAEHPGSFEILC